VVMRKMRKNSCDDSFDQQPIRRLIKPEQMDPMLSVFLEKSKVGLSLLEPLFYLFLSQSQSITFTRTAQERL
jgi:hypothetical protein